MCRLTGLRLSGVDEWPSRPAVLSCGRNLTPQPKKLDSRELLGPCPAPPRRSGSSSFTRIGVQMTTTGGSSLRWLSVLVLLAVASNDSDAQAERCSFGRAEDGLYRGTCTRGDTTVARLTFRHPTASTPHLWVGAGTFTDSVSVNFVVDVQKDGALQLGREWLAVNVVKHDSVALEFSFNRGTPLPPSHLDTEILRSARAYLLDPSHWNSADSTDMDAAPTAGFKCQPTVARSMFCALYFSSIAVAGHYAHFRPAMNAVRQAINAASSRRLRHPLVDFNNEPTTTLSDVQGVLDAAQKSIQGQLRGAG